MRRVSFDAGLCLTGWLLKNSYDSSRLSLFAATVVCWKPAILGIAYTLERTGIRSSPKVVRRD